MSCYKTAVFQNGATATGNGTAHEARMVNDGQYYDCTFQVTGITTATITWEATIDGTNWVSILATNLTSGTAAATATANGLYRATVQGLAQVRARISAYTSGTIVVTGVFADM